MRFGFRISAYQQTAELVNLYSTSRGINRWIALVRVLDLLREREEVKDRRVTVPSGEKLKESIASGYPLSDVGLREYAAEHPDPEFDQALAWNDDVNASIEDMVKGVPPFPTYARACW